MRRQQKGWLASLCIVSLFAFGACKTGNGAEQDSEVDQEVITAGEINDREGIAEPGAEPGDYDEIRAELILEGDEDLFDELDTNKDRSLDRNEFIGEEDLVSVLGYFAKGEDRRLGEKEFYDALFDRWDLNDDGFITTNEYLTGALKWFPGDTKELENFADVDANDDGLLTKPAFVANMDDVAMFDQWDLDDDAEIDGDELVKILRQIWDVDRDEKIAKNEFGGPKPSDRDVVAGITYVPVNVNIPVERTGTIVTGTARVGKVMTDRGFWLHSGDQKIFAVVREDVPRPEMIDINENAELRLTGIVLETKDMDLVAGKLEAETQKIIQGETHFLSTYHGQITIL